MIPGCDRAKAFFTKFQNAVNADRRKEVAAMMSYPLRFNRDSKSTMIKTKADLLAHYDAVFDPGTLCAIKAATVADVWGNWQGFMVGEGVIWWDRIIPNSAAKNGTILPSGLGNYPFGVFAVNHSQDSASSCLGSAKGPGN